MREHNTQRNAASQAVIDLRTALGMSQQRFAVEELSSALNTVARYETTNPPRGEALLRLAKIATDKNLPEIAAKFRKLRLDEILSALANTITVNPDTLEGWLVVRLSGRERVDDAIDFFEEKLRKSPKDEPEWAAWKKHLGYQRKKRK
jgi:transcriptional regulator with XRE-family HTH domain